jgi:hypothetical protein
MECLVSTRTSRIARAMREHLGKARWRSFVTCPRAFVVRVDDPAGAFELLESLHLDRTHDVGNVCSVWRASDPEGTRRWSAGIDRACLCGMLFGVTAADGLEQCLHHVRLEPWSSWSPRRAPLPLAVSAFRVLRL